MADAVTKLPDVKKDAHAESPPAKLDKLSLVIMLITVLNLAAIGGMAVFMQKMWERVAEVKDATVKLATAAPDEEEEEGADGEKKPMGKELEPSSLGILYPIESFLLNVQTDQGPKFLQMQLEFELAEPSLEEEIARKKPAIRDAIIVLISGRQYKDLRDVTGMKKLRTDILASVNNLLSTGKVKEIYFTQFHFN